MYVQPTTARRATALILLAAALSVVTGCGKASPLYVATWHTDITPVKNNDVQKFFADSLKFSVAINPDGTLVSCWTGDDGKEQTRSGTWKQIEGDGLRWTLAIALTQPHVDEMNVRIVSTSNRGISIESLDAFRTTGGNIHFKKR